MHSNCTSVTTDLEKANIFNDYFYIQAPCDHPVPSITATAPININISEEDVYSVLHHLFSLTLKYGYLPTDWKIHKIIPIFKSGNPTLVKNYQPISLFSNTSNVLERMIYDKLIDHISCQINPAQFGFMQSRSTTQ